ncbi:M14-type cytosolic carboxypeptidase [Kiritimatiellota bacterium B12222]|nr:M14-type cytosolic carboxypeptidase [Kiritimatiellota bacterium B12222]
MKMSTHLEIDSNFPGGNIVVERKHEHEVHLHQELRGTGLDWFYWYFRVSGAAGKTLRFYFTESKAIGVRGPAVSLDHGATWSWLGKETVRDNSFSYTCPKDVTTLRLSFTMPYLASHWQNFITGLKNDNSFSLHKLCMSEKGREVEYMLAGCQQAEPQHRVAITCRHHCCETSVNYTVEGLIQWVVDSNDSDAQWFRNNIAMLIVPFVDKDGVEEGEQGKGRLPRDHGRDYEGESIFASTEAIRTLLPHWGADQLQVGLDLHCPWISGPHNEVIYLVGCQDQRTEREQRRFSEILEAVRKGPLPFYADDFLPFGKAWNSSENFTKGKTFSQWLTEMHAVQLSTTIEIPYANAHGAEINQESARAFGQDLAMALVSYLRNGS